jgi:hypothetical protein
MTTRTHIRSSAAAALAFAAILVSAVPALAAPAHRSSDPYPWPVKPFDQPHPVRGSFGDPRTVFHGPPTQRTLLSGSGSFTFHTGVDISAPDGTAVYPVESGTVASVQHDWLAVSSGDRVFQYWHVTASVRQGDHVDAQQTVLGHIIRGCGHVHLTEVDGGTIVNPLADGHLTPYDDHTTPTVGPIVFRTSVTGADLMPELLRGRVEIIASAQDLPALPVPGAWADLPVTPALITWQIRKADTHKVVVPQRTAYDVRTQLPSPLAFWQVYARGSHQNMSVFGKHYSYLQPGVYRFRLAADGFDTRALPDAVYEIVVTATDIRGNHSTAVQRFSIHNKPGVVGS